jgi:hypothetical protein
MINLKVTGWSCASKSFIWKHSSRKHAVTAMTLEMARNLIQELCLILNIVILELVLILDVTGDTLPP